MTYDPIEHFREKARKGLARKLQPTRATEKRREVYADLPNGTSVLLGTIDGEPKPRKPRKRRAKAPPVELAPLVHYPARGAVVRVWTLCRACRKGPPHVMSRDPLGVTCPACLASMRAAELQLLIPGCEK